MGERSALGSSPFEKFCARLAASRILTENQLSTLAERGRKAAREPTPNEVAGWLVREKWLTRWQAETMLAGAGHTFRLGKYLLLDKLGAGGMGAVYKAVEVGGMGRTVAVKTMADHLLDKPQSIGRFRREIHAAAALSHPNIIRIYDAESLGRRHFLVMEYAEGCDLESVLEKQGPLPIPLACDFVRQAAKGLQHAYERGMIHRDIKPQNLFVCHVSDSSPLVKILDMGLAKFARDADANLTGTGQLLGTPDYMAPEQVDDIKNIDIRADVYSLGCTLFKLLTGQAPFAAAGVNPTRRMLARLAQEAPSIRKVRSDIPAELDAVIARMMARSVADRCATPQDVVDALAPFTRMDFDDTTEMMAPVDAAKKPDSVMRTQEMQRAILEQTRSSVVGNADVIEAKVDADLEQFYRQLSEREEVTVPTERRLGWRSLAGAASLAVLLLSAVSAAAWYHSGRSTLIIEIPEGGAGGVKLWVNGKSVPLPTTGPVDIIDSWGDRRIKLTRPEYGDVNAAFSLNYGETRRFAPEWKMIPPKPLVAPFLEKTAKHGQQAWAKYLNQPARVSNSIGMQFSFIPPGEFMMGAADGEHEWALKSAPTSWMQEKLAPELPRHRVRITKPFYLQTTEVTVGQYRQFIAAIKQRSGGKATSKAGEDSVKADPAAPAWDDPIAAPSNDHPVVNVSWYDANKFVEWLKQQDGRPYRLPTEAQWEYACRAGTDTWWQVGNKEFGLTQVAWYSINNGGNPQPVARKYPNAFGLYDMHGNVWEWCAEWADAQSYKNAPTDDPAGYPTGTNRVLRGGACDNPAIDQRSSRRLFHGPSFYNRFDGFRVAIAIE